jgi:hypothetical protein
MQLTDWLLVGVALLLICLTQIYLTKSVCYIISLAAAPVLVLLCHWIKTPPTLHLAASSSSCLHPTSSFP